MPPRASSLPRYMPCSVNAISLHLFNSFLFSTYHSMYSTKTHESYIPPLDKNTALDDSMPSFGFTLAHADHTDLVRPQELIEKTTKSCNTSVDSAAALQLLGSVTPHNIICNNPCALYAFCFFFIGVMQLLPPDDDTDFPHFTVCRIFWPYCLSSMPEIKSCTNDLLE